MSTACRWTLSVSVVCGIALVVFFGCDGGLQNAPAPMSDESGQSEVQSQSDAPIDIDESLVKNLKPGMSVDDVAAASGATHAYRRALITLGTTTIRYMNIERRQRVLEANFAVTDAGDVLEAWTVNDAEDFENGDEWWSPIDGIEDETS